MTGADQMAWLSLSIETDCLHAEALADALLEAGALAVSIEDADAGTADEKPQFGEPGSITRPGWDRSRVSALVKPDTDSRLPVSYTHLDVYKRQPLQGAFRLAGEG